MLLVDTVQTVLVISQLVPGHQRLPGEETEHLDPELDTAHVAVWVLAACSGYLLLLIREHLILNHNIYLKLKVKVIIDKSNHGNCCCC